MPSPLRDSIVYEPPTVTECPRYLVCCDTLAAFSIKLQQFSGGLTFEFLTILKKKKNLEDENHPYPINSYSSSAPHREVLKT